MKKKKSKSFVKWMMKGWYCNPLFTFAYNTKKECEQIHCSAVKVKIVVEEI